MLKQEGGFPWTLLMILLFFGFVVAKSFFRFWKLRDIEKKEIDEKSAKKIWLCQWMERFLGELLSQEREAREIDTSAEREIKIFHGPFITFFCVFLINDLLASLV